MTFSSPVATAEFSKFASILRTALSQHHLSGFEIAQLNSITSTSFVCSDFPGGSDGKASVYNAGVPGLIPGLGKSAGEGNGNPLQYHCLENPMDRGSL